MRKFKINQKVEVDKEVCHGIPYNNQDFRVAGYHHSQDLTYLVCFGEQEGWGSDWNCVSANISDKFKSKDKNVRFLWVSENQLEKIGMIENLKESCKLGAKAYGHGAAVGASEEGVDFAYQFACGWLHSQMGIPMEKLQDPLNKEIIQTGVIFLLQMMSGTFQDTIPGMEIIQTGCGLALEGKGRDHFKSTFKTVGPMLMHVSGLMDPKKHMEKLSKDIEKEFKEQGFDSATTTAQRFSPELDNDEVAITAEAEAEAEAEAQTSQQQQQQVV